jgi:hypothetical protein
VVVKDKFIKIENVFTYDCASLVANDSIGKARNLILCAGGYFADI